MKRHSLWTAARGYTSTNKQGIIIASSTNIHHHQNSKPLSPLPLYPIMYGVQQNQPTGNHHCIYHKYPPSSGLLWYKTQWNCIKIIMHDQPCRGITLKCWMWGTVGIQNGFHIRERPLMTSLFRVGRGVQNCPKKGTL